ncbi:death domain-containing protein CRADD-like [Sinocyclocheilus grahami]|uniref:Death domain-containing protein CRADD-like n=1 Tax=Sinocyclocheilus grahami TaxID=75366 RepID=A0A672QJ18_SINGR|nr:PREDICTED: death domain-containing protein CRADD-like [Sinocyclocheilus grahami]
MDPKHKKLLRSQRLFLAEELLVDDMIIQYLYQEEILTERHLEEIQSESSNRKKTLKLLDILPTRGSRAFHHFIQSLEKDFPWIKDKLLRLCAEDTESPPPSFTVQCGVPDHILPTVPTTQHLNRLAARLSSEWKSVLLDLGLSSADLYRCCAEHPLAVQSQVLAGLVMWTQRNGREATVRHLLQSLQAADIPPSVLQQVFV